MILCSGDALCRCRLGLSKVSNCQVITTKGRATPKPRKVTSEPIIMTHTARGQFLLPNSLFLLPGKTGLTQPQTATQDGLGMVGGSMREASGQVAR